MLDAHDLSPENNSRLSKAQTASLQSRVDEIQRRLIPLLPIRARLAEIVIPCSAAELELAICGLCKDLVAAVRDLDGVRWVVDRRRSEQRTMPTQVRPQTIEAKRTIGALFAGGR